MNARDNRFYREPEKPSAPEIDRDRTEALATDLLRDVRSVLVTEPPSREHVYVALSALAMVAVLSGTADRDARDFFMLALGQGYRPLGETRMTTLALRSGFDSSAINWGGPDEPRTEHCSYCGDEIPEDSVPLILWNAEGRAAEFCDHCQAAWWGFDTFDDPVEPRPEPEARGRRNTNG